MNQNTVTHFIQIFPDNERNNDPSAREINVSPFFQKLYSITGTAAKQSDKNYTNG